MKAKDLQVGVRYKSGNTVQEVTRIDMVTEKSITYRTKRVFPDEYDGNFFQRKSLNTEIELA